MTIRGILYTKVKREKIKWLIAYIGANIFDMLASLYVVASGIGTEVNVIYSGMPVVVIVMIRSLIAYTVYRVFVNRSGVFKGVTLGLVLVNMWTVAVVAIAVF